MIKNVTVLTSNPTKSSDFLKHGFNVEAFQQEVIEVLSEDVAEVALHKSFDANLNNSIVEDTSLEVEGSHFRGTEIKHVYNEIADNPMYDGHKAIWKVALCYKKDDNYFISVGALNGFLKYPALKEGYHFNKIFAIELNGERVFLETLSDKEKESYNPRYQAIRQIVAAIESNNYSNLIKISKNDFKEWSGDYQVENKEVLKRNKI